MHSFISKKYKMQRTSRTQIMKQTQVGNLKGELKHSKQPLEVGGKKEINNK